MPRVHEAIGFVVLGVFTIGWIWGGVALVVGRDPGARFWIWITVEQVIAGVQAIVGILLLVLGYRPETWLHYVYGFGPLVILGIAHVMSREVTGGRAGGGRWTQPPALFTAASFICFGLALRALMTGLGVG
jgi:hypothetical protein